MEPSWEIKESKTWILYLCKLWYFNCTDNQRTRTLLSPCASQQLRLPSNNCLQNSMRRCPLERAKTQGAESEKDPETRGCRFTRGPIKQLHGIATIASPWSPVGRQQAWPCWYLSNQFIGAEGYCPAAMTPSSKGFTSPQQQYWYNGGISHHYLPFSPPSPRSLASFC